MNKLRLMLFIMFSLISSTLFSQKIDLTNISNIKVKLIPFDPIRFAIKTEKHFENYPHNELVFYPEKGFKFEIGDNLDLVPLNLELIENDFRLRIEIEYEKSNHLTVFWVNKTTDIFFENKLYKGTKETYMFLSELIPQPFLYDKPN